MALDEIQAKFGGKWKMYQSEHFEDFLKAMGYNVVLAKFGALANSEQDIEVKDGKIYIISKTGPKANEETFQLDEEFEMELNGVKRKVVYSYKDGILEMKSESIDSTSPFHRVVREIVNEEMLMIIKLHGIRMRADASTMNASGAKTVYAPLTTAQYTYKKWFARELINVCRSRTVCTKFTSCRSTVVRCAYIPSVQM